MGGAHRTILSIYWCWDWNTGNFLAKAHSEVRRRRIVISGLPTIQELSFVAGRIEKPSAGISKDRLSLRYWTATQVNPLRMLRIATPSDAI
jgi:hypothetical protein